MVTVFFIIVYMYAGVLWYAAPRLTQYVYMNHTACCKINE